MYENTALVAALGPAVDGFRSPVSSSTQPSLMLWMLNALEVRAGDRVLEIGAGTGYNASLLTHRLGDAHVFTIGLDAELVGAARTRLNGLGLAPTVAVADGALGLPAHAPYDHVVVTCSVPAIPPAWVG